MKTQHTPGPWKAVIYTSKSNKTPHPGICSSDGIICELWNRPDALANAQLIHAAPELLGACLSALRALEDNLEPGPLDEDAKQGLRAAISKATE